MKAGTIVALVEDDPIVDLSVDLDVVDVEELAVELVVEVERALDLLMWKTSRPSLL
jgi:hypothetical protein